MKNSPKTILSSVVVSILAFNGYIQTTYAHELPSHLLARTQSQSTNSVQIAEIDSPHDRDSSHEDGDREASDVKTVPLTRAHRKHQVNYRNIHHKRHHVRRQHTK
jgi:hypothetical protein